MDLTPPEEVARHRARRILRTVLRRKHLAVQATALLAPDVPRAEILEAVDAAAEMVEGRRVTIRDDVAARNGVRLVLHRDDMERLMREYLRAHPEARSPEVVAHLRRYGELPVSKHSIPSICSDIRKELGTTLRPDLVKEGS